MPHSTLHEAYLRKHGIYFYFPEKTISEDVEQYTTMIIVAGLRELGYPCYSNVAHPLLAAKPITQVQNDFVVLDVTQANYSAQLMDAFANLKCRGKLLHSRADTNSEMITHDTVTALMAHESRFIVFKQRRQPWAFGLSDKWVKRHANTVPFSERRPVIVRNFRPSMAQGVRAALDLALIPHLEKHFTIHRAIDVSSYPDLLANSIGCVAYGGEFTSDLLKNSYFQQYPSIRQLGSQRQLLLDTVVVRWDSWRFWESLAAGCLTFHLDFEKHGFRLPEMPLPWIHYIPVDLADPQGCIEQLMDRRAEWAAIAEAGRNWALAHYTPGPTAKRFIQHCIHELSCSQRS